MAREDFTFAHRLRVRWAEVDMQGIVFNAHYLTYFDVGITEYWRAIGLRYPEGLVHEYGTDIYVVKSVIEYHRSARYDDELDVCGRIARIGRSSMQFVIEIHRVLPAGETEHLISGEVVYVNADPHTQRSAPIPASLRELIVGYEKTPVAQ